jgi:TPR repeat protein
MTTEQAYAAQRFETGYAHFTAHQFTEAISHFEAAAKHGHPLALSWLEQIYHSDQSSKNSVHDRHV